MASSLTEVLAAACEPNDSIRQPAEQHLAQAEENDTGGFMIALCEELSNDNTPPNVRQMAGLQLKNVLDGRSAEVQALKTERYKGMDTGLRAQLKNGILQVCQLSSSLLAV